MYIFFHLFFTVFALHLILFYIFAHKLDFKTKNYYIILGKRGR